MVCGIRVYGTVCGLWYEYTDNNSLNLQGTLSRLLDCLQHLLAIAPLACSLALLAS